MGLVCRKNEKYKKGLFKRTHAEHSEHITQTPHQPKAIGFCEFIFITSICLTPERVFTVQHRVQIHFFFIIFHM